MKIFKGFGEVKNIMNPVVTTGSFDGVHLGHKTILNRLNKLADKYNGESVLITFDPHPRKVLYPETAGKDLKLINSQEEKLDLLEKTGLNNVIIIEFTLGFSKVTSEQFVRDFLSGILNAKVVVAGLKPATTTFAFNIPERKSLTNCSLVTFENPRVNSMMITLLRPAFSRSSSFSS